MSWLPFQIGSMILVSVNSILDKRLVRDYQSNPVVYLSSFVVVGLPVIGVGMLVIPGVDIATAGSGVLAGLAFSLAVLLYYKAMRLDEVSRLTPVLRLSGVFKLLLLSAFLGERLTELQYLSFGLMFVGTFILAWKIRRSDAVEQPRLSSGMILMGVVACLLAINGVLESSISLMHTPWVTMVWSNVGTMLGFVITLFSRSMRSDLAATFLSTPWRFRWILLCEQLGRLATGLFSNFAIKDAGSASLVSLADGFRPLLVLGLAALFLGERLTRQELLPKLLGIMLIGSGGLVLLVK